MQMTHADFSRSAALRTSLKRGLARQALSEADRDSADLPGLFALVSGLRPNPKGVERMAARLRAQPGIARVALTPDHRSLRFTARVVRRVEAQVQGETAFNETSLIYVRSRAEMSGGQVGFRVSAVSFCGHALERLVERSDLPLTALLPAIDAEAQAIFRGWDSKARIAEDDDEYYPASAPGVWAGGHDRMRVDPDWGLTADDGLHIPIFSVRTFLSGAEMRPTLYLRWRNDPAYRIL